MLLGEEIVHVGYRYRTNMEAYSLISAWAFQFEDEVDKVKNTLRVVIDGHYLLNLDSVCARVVPKVGISPEAGVAGLVLLLSLIRWADDDLKERCRALACPRWKAFKLFARLMQCDEVLTVIQEVARAKVGRELRPRPKTTQAIKRLSEFYDDPEYRLFLD